MYLSFISFLTLSFFVGTVGFVLLLISYYQGGINGLWLIVGTIIFNFFIWLLAPFFMDLIQRIFYKIKAIEIEELANKSPKSAEFIRRICKEYNFKIPKLRLIEDNNPTAYCFGSGRFNSRLAISEGLFKYLDDDEVESVIAHEMGHIVRRDFIVMTIASTFNQVLYELATILIHSRLPKKVRGPLKILGYFSHVLYIIGTYIILFLSRTREYGADEFSAVKTKNPNGLIRALIKIAYGINQEGSDPKNLKTRNILKSTEALGISNQKNSKNIGNLFESNGESLRLPSTQSIARVMAFDNVSIWAKFLEISSTHPLTGKRIMRLNKLCKDFEQKPFIDFSLIKSEIDLVDRAKLKKLFIKDILVLLSPFALFLLFFILGIVYRDIFIISLGVVLFFVAKLMGISYRYPKPENIQDNTVLSAMMNVYASPIRGKFITVDGQAVGRGVAGSYVSEDMVVRDKTGIIYANYESAIPFFGNFFAGFLGKIKKLIEEETPSRFSGWFFRGIYQKIDLKEIQTPSKLIKSYPTLHRRIILIIGLVCTIFVSIFSYQEVVREGFVNFMSEYSKAYDDANISNEAVESLNDVSSEEVESVLEGDLTGGNQPEPSSNLRRRRLRN